MTRQGFPTVNNLSGISLFTTLPANTVVADCASGQHTDMCTYPYVITYGNRSSILRPVIPLFYIEGMPGSILPACFILLSYSLLSVCLSAIRYEPVPFICFYI